MGKFLNDSIESTTSEDYETNPNELTYATKSKIEEQVMSYDFNALSQVLEWHKNCKLSLVTGKTFAGKSNFIHGLELLLEKNGENIKSIKVDDHETKNNLEFVFESLSELEDNRTINKNIRRAVNPLKTHGVNEFVIRQLCDTMFTTGEIPSVFLANRLVLHTLTSKMGFNIVAPYHPEGEIDAFSVQLSHLDLESYNQVLRRARALIRHELTDPKTFNFLNADCDATEWTITRRADFKRAHGDLLELMSFLPVTESFLKEKDLPLGEPYKLEDLLPLMSGDYNAEMARYLNRQEKIMKSKNQSESIETEKSEPETEIDNSEVEDGMNDEEGDELQKKEATEESIDAKADEPFESDDSTLQESLKRLSRDYYIPQELFWTIKYLRPVVLNLRLYRLCEHGILRAFNRAKALMNANKREETINKIIEILHNYNLAELNNIGVYFSRDVALLIDDSENDTWTSAISYIDYESEMKSITDDSTDKHFLDNAEVDYENKLLNLFKKESEKDEYIVSLTGYKQLNAFINVLLVKASLLLAEDYEGAEWIDKTFHIGKGSLTLIDSLSFSITGEAASALDYPFLGFISNYDLDTALKDTSNLSNILDRLVTKNEGFAGTLRFGLSKNYRQCLNNLALLGLITNTRMIVTMNPSVFAAEVNAIVAALHQKLRQILIVQTKEYSDVIKYTITRYESLPTDNGVRIIN